MDTVNQEGSIAIAVDWATNTLESIHSAREIDKKNPAFTMHLGDTYFVGEPDEIAANCLGINIASQKLFAFVIGSIFCGLAGSLLVGLAGYVGPDSYDFSKSLMLICIVILGGMDNSIGIIVGAFILTIISEKLRDFADYQQLVYSLVLVIMLIIRPNGIIPRRVRKYFNTFRSSTVAKTIEAEKAQAIDFNK